MSLTLLVAPDNMPLAELTDRLRQEGANVSAVKLDTNFGRETVADAAELIILISLEKEPSNVRAWISRVRSAIGHERQLVLCLPVAIERQVLIDQGADEIIIPGAIGSEALFERVLAHLILKKQIEPHSLGALYGATKPMRELYGHIEKLAPKDAAILLLGERGTGKELVAAELHKRSGRDGLYVAFNCAAISTELFASEVFGCEKGAFTGAVQRRGRLSEAKAGTAFLDEIGDLKIEAQVMLLRVLEEKKVWPVGADRPKDISARIILGTNHNLGEDAQVGSFKPDLYDRINRFTLELPPLRERKADIPLLVEHFISACSNKDGPPLKLPLGAVNSLFRYHWPGNVRELLSVVDRAVTYAENGYVSDQVFNLVASEHKTICPKLTIEYNPQTEGLFDVEKKFRAAYFKAMIAESVNKEDAIRRMQISRQRFYEIQKELKESGLL